MTDSPDSPDVRLAAFLAKFDAPIATRAAAILARLRRQLPHAVELVYDNYNALAIGFGPSERASEAVCSVVLYPRWVTLFLLRGKGLDDPTGILKGKGSQVRHIVLPDASALDDPAVQALIQQAIDKAPVPFDPAASPRITIRSVVAKQRARKPANSALRPPRG